MSYNKNYGVFRGKAKCGGDWVEGCLVKRYNGYVGIDRPHPTFEFELVEVIPESVVHYFGWNDSTDKKIFTGNIALGPCNTRVVFFFDHESLAYKVKTIDRDGTEICISLHPNTWHLYTVIGNVFDNPELYKGEKP